MAEPPSVDPALAATSSSGAYSSSSSAVGGGDASFPFDTKVEGYDYDFVPPADNRYECAICLFVLREPWQTPCGHRFCKNCILRWLRGSTARCPVDNEELSEKDLFPDNFARREIQNFIARCPNHRQGCEVTATVKELPTHQNECPLALVPCPNSCANILLRRDLPRHVDQSCVRRNVQCPDCANCFLALNFEAHAASCPRGLVTCQVCQDNVLRETFERHEQELCLKKVVPCSFALLGCQALVQRGDMDDHLRDSLAQHMSMLCQGVVKIFRVLNLDPQGSEVRPSSSSRDLSPTEMSGAMSMMAPVVHQLASLDVNSFRAQQASLSSFPQQQARPTTARSPGSASLDSSSSSSSSSTTRGGGGQAPPMRRSPSDPKHLPSTGTLQEASLMQHMSGGSLGEADGGVMSGGRWQQQSSQQSSHQQQRGGDSVSKSWGSISEEQKLVLHGQTLLELQAKFENSKQKIKQQEQLLSEMEGRICGGQFYWKIGHYSRYQREAERGETTALHSQPFYTSPSGYKLCVRANLNGVDSARGSHLSLFIHFMQGDYDDVLDWPFSGRIVLSVVDQNERCPLRNHVAETLAAKPSLAAFQKPSTPRNHKGFGYMEFLPLSALKNSTYIKNDTLIIKAQVLPNG